jgi:hypothetical protein
MKRQIHKKRLQHREGTNFPKDNQVNNCFGKWRQDYQMMVLAIVQMGNSMIMVIKGEWWKVKKSNLNLLLKLINKSKKEERVVQCCCEV